MAAQRLVPDGAILCNYAVGCSINITMCRTPLNSIALATHSSATDHQLLLSRRCSTSSTHIMDNWSSGEIQVQVLQVRVHACVHTCARVCLTISRNTPCFFLFSKPRQQPVSVLLSVGDLFELYRAHLQKCTSLCSRAHTTRVSPCVTRSIRYFPLGCACYVICSSTLTSRCDLLFLIINSTFAVTTDYGLLRPMTSDPSSSLPVTCQTQS